MFGRVLTEYLGGQEAIEVAVRYHEDTIGMRTLAQEHDMTLRAVHTLIHTVRRKLRAIDMMPETWEQRAEQSTGNQKHLR